MTKISAHQQVQRVRSCDHEGGEDDVYKLLLAKERPDLEKQPKPNLVNVIMK